MRTTGDLDEDLLEEARRLGHFRTKQETLTAGLEELVRKAHRERLRSLAAGSRGWGPCQAPGGATS